MLRHKKPKFVHLYRDRHGKQRVYYRRPGRPRVPLPLPLYSEAFWIAYRAAEAQAEAPPEVTPKSSKVGQPRRGSVSALIETFYRSAEWRSLAASSKETYRRQYERFREEFGDARVAQLTTKYVNLILDRMADRPAAANNLRDRLNILMKFAVANDWIETNPVTLAKRIRHKTKGFRTWTEEDIARFQKRWPLGTPQRLAMELLLYTGLRRSDAVRLGRQHVTSTPEGEAFVLTAIKTGVELKIPIHPNLRPALATAPADQLVYIVTAQGAPRSPKAFTGWLKDAAKAAGLPPDSSPHGLRKAACRRLAEAGCSTFEIMSITGHQNLREVETYTAAVRRDRLARDAMGKVVSAFSDREDPGELANHPDRVANPGPQTLAKIEPFGEDGGWGGIRTHEGR
jgi:integrase